MSADPTRPLPSGGPAPAAPLAEHDALPPGTRFGEFEIIRVLGVGGFGIVYLAQDHSLERHVALKEYMPASLAARGEGPVITLRSGAFAETYAIGLRSFINEARMLARFDHPSLVKVYRFWEGNATAYMVMPYLQGITLRDARRAMAHAPDEAWIRSVLEPMLDALERLHGENVFHRDIAPDNILLPPEGPPILLDFGAARRVISDRTQSLTAILKPSYAPIEQYADMTAMRQGPWTDLYALGAVMHFLLFGVPPAPATARALHSDAGQIEQRAVPGVSPRFLSVVAWMLGVRPLERPQNVAALSAVLKGEVPVPSHIPMGVTVPGKTALMPVHTPPVPFPGTRIDTTFAPTMHVDRVHAGPAPPGPVGMPGMPFAPAPMAPEPAVATAWAPAPPPVQGAVSAAGPAGTIPSLARSRPGLLAAGIAAGVALAAVIVWQVVGVLGASPSRGLAAESAAPVAASAPPASAAKADPVVRETIMPTGATPAASRAVPTTSVRAEPALGATPQAAPAAAGPASHAKPLNRSSTPRSADGAAAARSPALPPDAVTLPLPEPMVNGRRESTNPTTSVAPAPAAGPATAREACGSRRFIALAVCLDRECERPLFRDSPECVAVLNLKRQRAEH